MLLGNFHHNLQAGRRLAIPSSFREGLGDTPILTRGIENCLNLLPFNTWSALTQNLGSHPLVSGDSRNLRRLLAHDAYQVEYDAQGRLLIPSGLYDWAGFKKTVVVAGSIDWVELWDLDNYKNYMSEFADKAGQLADRLAP